MKKPDSSLTIKRTSISPYFKASFKNQEHNALSKLGNFLEVGSELPADVLISNTHTKFSELSAEVKNALKLIIHPNSGYDNIPESFIKEMKAPIVIGNTIRASAVAQYILSHLLNHYTPGVHHQSWDQSRKWDRKLLNELKVQIIGYGHIGKLIHSSLRPLVKELNVYDPYENLMDFNYKNADVIILACSYNKNNHHLINQDFLKEINQDAFIINSSRGELIQTQALIDFLHQNPQSFAVLDVFEKEPNDFQAFKNLTNIRLSSHIAGVYASIDEVTLEFETQVVKDFIHLKDIDFKIKYQKMILQNKLRDNIGLI